MGSKDERVDAYIDRSAEFARPILRHLRRVVHDGCPKVEETMKWSFPHFMYKGILCSMASFKQHCAFGFWNKELRLNVKGEARTGEAMGQFGRIEALTDLPSEVVLLRYVREAVRLADSGRKPVPRPASGPKPALTVPSDLLLALKKSAKARATFDQFNYSHKKEYIEWLTEAKTDATRKRRLETAVEWMAQGKPRNWKYMERCSATRAASSAGSRRN